MGGSAEVFQAAMSRRELWLFQSGFKLTVEQLHVAKNSLKEQIRELKLQIQKHERSLKSIRKQLRKRDSDESGS